jgi:hypothetical protein
MIREFESRMRYMGYVAQFWKIRNSYKILVRRPEWESSFVDQSINERRILK